MGLRERDRRDAEREDSPLRSAEDAHRLVTDSLSPGEVVERVLELAGGDVHSVGTPYGKLSKHPYT